MKYAEWANLKTTSPLRFYSIQILTPEGTIQGFMLRHNDQVIFTITTADASEEIIIEYNNAFVLPTIEYEMDYESNLSKYTPTNGEILSIIGAGATINNSGLSSYTDDKNNILIKNSKGELVFPIWYNTADETVTTYLHHSVLLTMSIKLRDGSVQWGYDTDIEDVSNFIINPENKTNKISVDIGVKSLLDKNYSPFIDESTIYAFTFGDLLTNIGTGQSTINDDKYEFTYVNNVLKIFLKDTGEEVFPSNESSTSEDTAVIKSVQRGYWWDDSHVAPDDVIISISPVDISKSFVILSGAVVKELKSDKLIISNAYTFTEATHKTSDNLYDYWAFPFSWQVVEFI